MKTEPLIEREDLSGDRIDILHKNNLQFLLKLSHLYLHRHNKDLANEINDKIKNIKINELFNNANLTDEEKRSVDLATKKHLIKARKLSLLELAQNISDTKKKKHDIEFFTKIAPFISTTLSIFTGSILVVIELTNASRYALFSATIIFAVAKIIVILAIASSVTLKSFNIRKDHHIANKNSTLTLLSLELLNNPSLKEALQNLYNNQDQLLELVLKEDATIENLNPLKKQILVDNLKEKINTLQSIEFNKSSIQKKIQNAYGKNTRTSRYTSYAALGLSCIILLHISFNFLCKLLDKNPFESIDSIINLKFFEVSNMISVAILIATFTIAAINIVDAIREKKNSLITQHNTQIQERLEENPTSLDHKHEVQDIANAKKDDQNDQGNNNTEKSIDQAQKTTKDDKDNDKEKKSKDQEQNTTQDTLETDKQPSNLQAIKEWISSKKGAAAVAGLLLVAISVGANILENLRRQKCIAILTPKFIGNFPIGTFLELCATVLISIVLMGALEIHSQISVDQNSVNTQVLEANSEQVVQENMSQAK